jgi:hypothetical protein
LRRVTLPGNPAKYNAYGRHDITNQVSLGVA